MSLDHLNRLALAAGYATAVSEEDVASGVLVSSSEMELVPLTRSHWPDAPLPRGRVTTVALVAVEPLWRSQPVAKAALPLYGTVSAAMRSVTSLIGGRSVPA